MKNKSIITLFLRYVSSHRGVILMQLLSSAVFFIIFYLYDLNMDALLYAFLLIYFAGACILICSFCIFLRKHRVLVKTAQNVSVMASELPEADDIISEDYIRVISALDELNNRMITGFQSLRTESIDFYTAWVHQIKTPIAAMQLILQSDDTDEHRQLQAELFRIEQYTDMVLQYFRLDSSSSDLVIKKCSIDDIIKQSVRKYAPLFVRKRIKLIYEPSGAQIVTDEKWALMIIEQLLSNAVKYTASGSVTIEFSGENFLSVTDTGMGIAPDDIPRIFEKGFTGYNGRADKKSTGLGLYLCKKAADKIGCTISVVSEVGKGSAFFVDFGHEST